MTLRVTSSTPPQKFSFRYCRDELFELMYKEARLQAENGHDVLSQSCMAQALDFAFILYSPDGRKKPNTVRTIENLLSETFKNLDEESDK